MRCSCGQENPISATECPRCQRALLLGMDPKRLLIDVGAALALLLALGVVFLIDRGKAAPEDAGTSEGEGRVSVEEVEEKLPVVANPLRIAVTPPLYDDMGKLLDSLGAGYRYTTIDFGDLLDAERLGRYEVVFVTCGYVPDNWVTERLHNVGRDGGGIYSVRPRIARQLKQNLRGFVGRGGTLYVSDLLFDLLAIAFPETVDPTKVSGGAVQTVRARVVDPGLARLLGRETIELQFDKASWRPAAFAGPQITTLLSGTYRTEGGGKEMTGPLLVQFPFRDGNVVFTSFHNEKQNSETQRQLLRYLVFTTVTAQTDTKVKKTMVRGGFSPVDRSLLSASPKDQSIARTYDNPGRRDLQFVLGFADRGAELRLAVVGPVGRREEKTGTSTLTIDVPRAAEGQWKYTITPVKVPNENFPFTLTVGEKR